MKLISFQIKGFKSVIDSAVCSLSENDNTTVLAGQNEAGKSAVLEALDFFKNGPGTDFVKLQKRLDSPNTEVICTFNLNNEDIVKLKEGFNDEKINNFYKSKKSITVKRTWQEGSSPTGDLTVEDSTFDSLKFDEVKKQGKEESTVDRNAVIEALKLKIIENLPSITLYRQFTDFLPSEILVSDIPTNAAVLDFEKVFNVNLTQIANITDPRQLTSTKESLQDKATDDFNKSWSQKISLSDDTKYKYAIEVNQQEPKKIIFRIKGSDGKPLYLEQKSMGFRWFSAFHLRLRALGLDKSSNSNSILLVDEPGQNLHEKAQLDAKKVLEELASKGIQIIYSTHNARLIGTEGAEYLRIRLVSNSKINGTKVETISQFSSRPDNGNLDALSPIITAMGLSGITSFVEPNRFNVVVEGITDHYYLTALKHMLKKDKRLFFVPAVGVSNVPNVVRVLQGWGYNYRAVFDDDKNTGRKTYNLLKKEFFDDKDDLAHEYIYKIKDCNGIEDVFSKTDFYKFVLKKDEELANSSINSVLAAGKKEIIAREFLDYVVNNVISLDSVSMSQVKAIFDWLYQKF